MGRRDAKRVPMSDVPTAPTAQDLQQPDRARRLFRYLSGDEWQEYRAIMAVFAGTFFAEFTPDDVSARLAAAGLELTPQVTGDRLESLRGWGNLTVSSNIGNPTNLADYYRRRNRYLITRAGQEVHGLVEGVLRRVDEVRDVSAGRLRALLDAIVAIDATDVATVEPERLADLVRAVFDPHIAFTEEITQFFAAINQWQSRYDLTDDEFRFFTEVLVGYVGERLDEIERLARPIGRRLETLVDRVPVISQRLTGGLAERIERAGLTDTVAVSRAAGSDPVDWEHLAAWFVGRPLAPSRLERLRKDAVAAIRTLTQNLTRLSRTGLGASSRRADFLRLARLFHTVDPASVPLVAAASFGLYRPNHLGVVAEDALDPLPTSTSWWSAPPAPVPISIRERGDVASRGRPTPITDRSKQQEILRLRRAQDQRAKERIDAELVAAATGPEGALDGATMSPPALARLQHLVSRTSHRTAAGVAVREVTDAGLRCVVRRRSGGTTVIRTPDGTFTMFGLDVMVTPEGSG